MGCEFRSALFVRGGDLIGVLAAIQFDDELLFWASEVGDAIADRVLAAEFVEREAVAKGAPENLSASVESARRRRAIMLRGRT
jgi:hypothetical protein